MATEVQSWLGLSRMSPIVANGIVQGKHFLSILLSNHWLTGAGVTGHEMNSYPMSACKLAQPRNALGCAAGTQLVVFGLEHHRTFHRSTVSESGAKR